MSYQSSNNTNNRAYQSTQRQQRNTRPLCRFFNNGFCKFGEDCNFSHELPASSSVDAAVAGVASSTAIVSTESNSTPLCRYFARGKCRYGDSCMFSHDLLSTGSSSAVCMEASTAEDQGQKLKSDSSSTMELKKESKEKEYSCGICFEDIKKSEKRFGLLAGCDHVFCNECLMNWRTARSPAITAPSATATANRRCCPICRKHSGKFSHLFFILAMILVMFHLRMR